ncbi:MAG: amidohydrolase family protein, partial [Clostridia bacterium]|nr:amidohydrolase family protein [Clostridia bacterium]
GVCDGTIDMIATDHAPHSAEEKSAGLEKSSFGIVGLETAFPVMYTYLVKEKIITLEKLAELMSYNPRKRFGITEDAGFSVWALDQRFTVDSRSFKSMGRATPFEGAELYGKHIKTIYRGKTVC